MDGDRSMKANKETGIKDADVFVLYSIPSREMPK
jgi:hypothetical protein